MALSPLVYKTLEEQLELCMEIDDADITEAAKKIAFYTAMIDAALDDPFDDEEDQAEILKYLKKDLQQLTETYQELVNNYLP